MLSHALSHFFLANTLNPYNMPMKKKTSSKISKNITKVNFDCQSWNMCPDGPWSQ